MKNTGFKNITMGQLKASLKHTLIMGGLSHPADGSLTDSINQAIQWAWENWDSKIIESYISGQEKPVGYTKDFMNDWIENHDLYKELEEINDQYA